MMEESSDEQPEMVSREEAEEAEKEASGGTPAGSRSGSATPTKAGSPPPAAVPAPAPLPAFITSPSPQSPPASTPAQVPVQSQTPKLPSPPPASTSPASVPVTPSRVTPPRQPPTTAAPGPLQTPVEASSATPVSPHTPPVSHQGGAGEGGHGGLFGWISGSHLVSRVMEKTKSSVEHVITTLDPGMKEVLYSGGDMDVVVASAKENKVGAVREAFQKIFGRATVTGQETQAKTAAQPVGFTAGLKGAEERLQNLKQSGSVEEGQTLVALEGFIVEMLPDRWYELTCLVLQDSRNRIELQTFSQPTLIPTEFVLAAQDRTPSDYPLRWSGLAATIGQVVEEAQPHIGRSEWQAALSGVSRRESLFLAAKALAHMYKQRLPSPLTT